MDETQKIKPDEKQKIKFEKNQKTIRITGEERTEDKTESGG